MTNKDLGFNFGDSIYLFLIKCNLLSISFYNEIVEIKIDDSGQPKTHDEYHKIHR